MNPDTLPAACRRHKLRNRRGQIFFVDEFLPETTETGCAVVQHGFSGSTTQTHVREFIRRYLDAGYRVIAPDCTHSFNDSDGELIDATAETHIHDLEDTIAWAENQPWFRTPFALCGHSIGGFSVLHYAQKSPQKVKTLFPAAAVINGTLLEEAYAASRPEELALLRETGAVPRESERDGRSYKGFRSYTWFKSIFSYDMLENAAALTMPVLIVAGENDPSCPPAHQKKLFSSLPEGTATFHRLGEADHNYAPDYAGMGDILSSWLKNLTTKGTQK